MDFRIFDKEFGEGNWKVRRVSSNKKQNDLPSLTVTTELAKIGVKPKDYVVVAVKDNTVIIKKV